MQKQFTVDEVIFAAGFIKGANVAIMLNMNNVGCQNADTIGALVNTYADYATAKKLFDKIREKHKELFE